MLHFASLPCFFSQFHQNPSSASRFCKYNVTQYRRSAFNQEKTTYNFTKLLHVTHLRYLNTTFLQITKCDGIHCQNIPSI